MKTTACIRSIAAATVALAGIGTMSAQTEHAKVTPHPFHVPERALVLTGDTARLNDKVYAVFYNTENLMFNDPSVPRFQFVDREGNTIFRCGWRGRRTCLL